MVVKPVFNLERKENNLKKSDLSISMAESLHMLLTLLRECEKSQEDIGILINLTAYFKSRKEI